MALLYNILCMAVLVPGNKRSLYDESINQQARKTRKIASEN
jgi:hypothetical protein